MLASHSYKACRSNNGRGPVAIAGTTGHIHSGTEGGARRQSESDRGNHGRRQSPGPVTSVPPRASPEASSRAAASGMARIDGSGPERTAPFGPDADARTPGMRPEELGCTDMLSMRFRINCPRVRRTGMPPPCPTGSVIRPARGRRKTVEKSGVC